MLPENTTIARLTMRKLDDIKEDIIKYIIQSRSSDLSYEFGYETGYVPIFITGKNKDEDKLPIFKHPITIVFNDITYIVSNLRGIVYSDKVEDTISKVKRNHLSVDLEIMRNVLVYATLSKNSNMSTLISITGKPFALWLSTLLRNTMRIDEREVMIAEGVIYHYYMLTALPDLGIEKLKDKMTRYLSFVYRDRKFLSEVLDGLNNSPKTLDDLINNLKLKLPDGKLDVLSSSVLPPMVSDGWNISDIGSELCIMSLESPETWIALVSSSTDRLAPDIVPITVLVKKFSVAGMFISPGSKVVLAASRASLASCGVADHEIFH